MVVVEAGWYLVLSTVRVAVLVLLGMAFGLVAGLLLAPSAVASVTARLDLDSVPGTVGGGSGSFRAQLSEAAALDGHAGQVARALDLPALDDFLRRADRLLSVPVGSSPAAQVHSVRVRADVFLFFSNRLGCLGSLLLSAGVTFVLLLILNR